MMPWRPAGRKAGWRSTATLPVGGPQRHVISLYSRTAGLFGRTINPNTLKHLDTTLRLATERLLEQARSERVHSLYRALLAGENLAFHASSERQLLQRACAGIAENGLFQTAWIGRPQEDGMFGVLVAAGSGASALHELRIPVSDQEQGALVVRAWRDGRMHYNNDHLEDPQLQSWADFLRRHRWHAAAAVPLRRGNECWAVLAVVSDERGAFDQETLHLIARIGRLIGHALDEMDTKSALDDARQQALYLAHHDALTGLANRLVFEHHVPKAQARVLRAETLMAVGLLDLDDFKPVNDTWGHEAGDALLRRLSERLQEVLRESDCLCRLGGDEFAFVIEDLSGWESLDAILARFLLTLLTQLAIFLLGMGLIHLFYGLNPILDVPAIALSLAMAAALGLGIGTLNCYLKSAFPIWEHFFAILTAPLFILSTIIFTFESVPRDWRGVLWYNPLVHVVGMMRRGFYPSYDAPYVSPLYVFGVALVTLALGLVLLQRFHRDILNM